LFVALEPDAKARQHIHQLLDRVQHRLGPLSASVRWNPPDNIHLTLHFLGEVADARVPLLRAAVGERLSLAPFDLATGGLGTFPASGVPRVVWLAVQEGNDRAVGVHAEMGRRLTAAGFAVDSRPFSPHITLGRVRERDRHDARGISAAFRDVQIESIRWRVDRATLFRSHLSSSAPRYEALQHVVLTDYN
jgi:2'-5' RNA ligase